VSTSRESPLAGKVALVTGGSRGIGAAIAKRVAAGGASVAVTYSKGADAAASVVKEIERGGGKAIAIQADAADADAVTNAVERTVTTLGRLDMLVNNVLPKPIDTDLNPASGEWAVGQRAAVPLDRYGHVDAVAALVAFVAVPESSSINGANLTVDGGINA
jgi:NAD(P)-dependent dehydrogenase (short-subunit alcohol dehydrogenase family)